MASPTTTLPDPTGSVAHPWWPRLRRWAVPLLGLLVLGLLAAHIHKVDWAGAWQALRR